MAWGPLIIGYLVGSFFGVMNLLALVRGLFAGRTTAAAH